MEAVGVEQIFAFFVTFYATLVAANPLPGYPPQQPLALVAIGGGGGRPGGEIVGGSRANRVNQRLQGFLVDVHFLEGKIYLLVFIRQLGKKNCQDILLVN